MFHEGFFIFTNMNNKQIKNISLALIFCHLIVGFVPYLKAIDKITTQFLYLSIINSVSLIFIFLNHKFFFKSILQITNKLVFRHLFIFSLWGLGSFFYALNQMSEPRRRHDDELMTPMYIVGINGRRARFRD